MGWVNETQLLFSQLVKKKITKDIYSESHCTMTNGCSGLGGKHV